MSAGARILIASEETPTLEDRRVRQPEGGQNALPDCVQAVSAAHDAGMRPASVIYDRVVRMTVNDRIAAFIMAGESVPPPDEVFGSLFVPLPPGRIQPAGPQYGLGVRQNV